MFFLYICIYIYYIYAYRSIGILIRVFGNGPGDQGSSLDGIIYQSNQKMVLNASLLNTVL